MTEAIPTIPGSATPPCAPPSHRPPSRGAVPDRTDPGFKTSRKNILVIDDDIVLLKALSMKLRAEGFNVLTAVDGAAAVSVVRQVRPDLILLDLNFPPDVAHGGGIGWNGLVILSWLRRMEAAQNTPVIAITAGNLADYSDQCEAAGVVDLFLKPIDHLALLARIRETLSKQVPQPGSSEQEAPARRVLFVDDETDWRYMGTLYLSECGYDVVAAENAESALRQAAKIKPDLIVLDLNLAGENGVTVMGLLAVAHPEVPILIYTGAELDPASVADLREQGAFDCLQKGTMEELLTAVGEAIAAGAPEKDAAPKKTPELPPGINLSGIQSVLLVEDDLQFGETIRIFLESHPYCVTHVIDGAEALRQMSAVDFDIILCDMMVANLPGDQLYVAVEQVKPHMCGRFIFMTGHHADPKTDAFIRRVRGLMLWKPFPMADLLTAAETIRKKNPSRRLVAV